MKRIIKWSLIFFFLFGVAAATLYALYLASDESLYFRRNSFAYYLFIDSFIENVPRPEIIGEPLYYNTCGDGAKMPGAGIIYESRASRAEIFRQINQYFTDNGYHLIETTDGLSDYSYENSRYFIRFSIHDEPQNAASRVVITRTF